jgi:C-terminal processing protease CtpA/Prc
LRMDFFACCSNRMIDREGRDAFAQGMPPDAIPKASPKMCGLGIAFKPDKRGNLFVKRLVPGGPADIAKVIEVRVPCHTRKSPL